MRIEAGPVAHPLADGRVPHLDGRYEDRLVELMLRLLDRAGIRWETTSCVDLRLDERHAGEADAIVEHWTDDDRTRTVTRLRLDLAELQRDPPSDG